MIVGPTPWHDALAAEWKWALYYLYLNGYGYYITSFVPILANVALF